jgi:hypothetical protein
MALTDRTNKELVTQPSLIGYRVLALETRTRCPAGPHHR